MHERRERLHRVWRWQAASAHVRCVAAWRIAPIPADSADMNALTSQPVLFPVRRISTPALRRALIAGARRVIADRDVLNRINVFPVADGDTGNNMAFTLGTVLAGALSRRAVHAGELLRQVGADAIDGARGNSGAILAQFLQGMSEAVAAVPVLDTANLSRAVRRGADAARAALSEPREGTILSVIHAFAEALQHGHGQRDMAGWIHHALLRAREALAETPKQLAVLQKAGVVDAGAQGFVDLIEGVVEFIQQRRGADAWPSALGVADLDDLADDEAAVAHRDACGDADHRWCSECLILAESIDRDALRAQVAALAASSVVIAGSPTRVRVHAHVSDPQALFEVCACFGVIEACKADDMYAQQRAVAAGTAVAIVTDSAADLPLALIEQLHIHVVPLRINFGDRDYLDKVSLSPAEFYRKLRNADVLPRTSQPPPGDFRRQFEFLLAHHPRLIYVGLSRAVSGTLQSAESAAARLDADRTTVFDTANAAGGQALLAIAAAELALAGADTPTILGALERLRPLTHTFALARDISHAVRGGRVPAWAKPLAQWLGLTPIAQVSAAGKLRVVSALLGSRRAPTRFARYVAKRVDHSQRWRLVVGHCDSPADGAALRDALARLLDCESAWLVETGPAVGAHAGPGALVVSLQPFSTRCS
ncbi:MAG: hypothetical protein COW59_02810 [Lysobacterales bacterium CG17_big_fil_post_rev_8_21_14_2_50_64_11]|nr:MAG: hypothetical protein COW59_02810 [Xanthomonadales bacterium CG17_big_fil_post_rev_8_21_14_2_50_64_11]